MTRAIKAHLGDFIALMVLVLIAFGVVVYIFAHQFSRPTIPLIESTPFTLKGEFSTAQAVTPGQGQSIRVAGVQVGRITGVTLQNGVAVVTTQIDAKWVKKLNLRSDATMLLRPRTGLKDMFIELDPGGSGTPLHSGSTIPVSNTAPDVNPDEILSTLDGDTRQYLELLINSAGKGLQGHGDDLNAVFKALGPTNADLKRLTQAIATRRADLRALIHNYGDLTNTLADTDGQIQTLVTQSDRVFRAFASQSANISAAVSKLPPTLQQTTSTLQKVNVYAPLLSSTLTQLEPPFRQLNSTNQQILPFMRIAYPITKNQIRPFVRVARPYVRQLRPASINLANAAPDLTATFHELNRFFNMLAYNPQGRTPISAAPNQEGSYLFWLGWLTQNTDSLFSTSDSLGPLRRAYLSFDCNELKLVLAQQPALGPLTGLSNVLNDPGLCTTGSSVPLPTLPGLPGLPGIIPLAPKKPPASGAQARSGSGSGAQARSGSGSAGVPAATATGGRP